ncbi:MAG: hypothetical protein N3A69_18530, partial [Leptospiraceae bacterium]|nr:hypothetical protein [Leptospiraceae bacterium]
MNFANQTLIKEVSLTKEIFISLLFDSSILHFGTKLRKAKGLHKKLELNKIKSIVIHGNPNSNYMACFSTYFRANSFKVHSLIYSYSQNRNLNYWITIRNSSEILEVKSKLEFQSYLDRLQNKGIY